MKIKMILLLWLYTGMMATVTAQSGTENKPWQTLELNNLEIFETPAENWKIAGDIFMDFKSPLHIEKGEGTGILINDSEGDSPQDIFTVWEHGDLDLELDVMMAKNSNSGIYLQGRYELQLLDSWGVLNPRFSDMGGVYEWWEDGRGTGGIAPRVNASRAPGLWQTFTIRFRAPRFDDSGEKIANARLEKVTLNGEVIHENVDLVHPTGGAISNEEAVAGPLRFQGDHGPVAFRNIRYRAYSEPLEEEKGLPENYEWIPMTLNPGSGAELVHGFMKMNDNDIRTHSAAVGYSHGNGVHFALDLNSGSLLKVWKGNFLNISTMWVNRGGGNLSLNEEAAISFSGVPSVAVLSSRNSSWPAVQEQEGDYRFKNYRFDETAGQVIFSYELQDIKIEDQLVSVQDGSGLTRTLNVSGGESSENLYVKAASGSKISVLANGVYQVGDHSYYIEIDGESGTDAWIRSSEHGDELLIPFSSDESSSVSYSIFW